MTFPSPLWYRRAGSKFVSAIACAHAVAYVQNCEDPYHLDTQAQVNFYKRAGACVRTLADCISRSFSSCHEALSCGVIALSLSFSSLRL